MQLTVAIEQSSSAVSYCSDPAAVSTTSVYLLLLPAIASDQSTFSTQFASTTWNTSTATVKPARCECAHAQVPVGSYTGGLVRAEYAPSLGTSTWAITTDTSFVLGAISVGVVVVRLQVFRS